MKRIYKQQLKYGRNVVKLQQYALPVAIHAQQGVTCLWFEIDTYKGVPAPEPVAREFCVIHTGEPIKGNVRYLGSAFHSEQTEVGLNDGAYVTHVYEVLDGDST